MISARSQKARSGFSPPGFNTRVLVSLAATIALSTMSVAPDRAHGQEVRARVVDSDSRRPIRGASATLASLEGVVVAATLSNDSGFFQIHPPREGVYTLSIGRSGYASETRTVTIPNDPPQILAAFVLNADVVQLDSIEVQGQRGAGPSPAVVGFSRSSHVMSGERMARLEAGAGSLPTVLRELPGLRVRELNVGGRRIICVESTRRLPSFAPEDRTRCNSVSFVLDGVVVDITTGTVLLRAPGLGDYESIEYLTPVEAGWRYGMEASANGAVVIWTRGRGPHASAARNRDGSG